MVKTYDHLKKFLDFYANIAGRCDAIFSNLIENECIKTLLLENVLKLKGYFSVTNWKKILPTPSSETFYYIQSYKLDIEYENGPFYWVKIGSIIPGYVFNKHGILLGVSISPTEKMSNADEEREKIFRVHLDNILEKLERRDTHSRRRTVMRKLEYSDDDGTL